MNTQETKSLQLIYEQTKPFKNKRSKNKILLKLSIEFILKYEQK